MAWTRPGLQVLEWPLEQKAQSFSAVVAAGCDAPKYQSNRRLETRNGRRSSRAVSDVPLG
jgi:hypothetical protein